MTQFEGGTKNLLTDVAGLRVGHAGDEQLISGVTTVLFDQAATCARAVLGGAPAGRDGECLDADKTVESIDALVLSGGSGFGLDAASGVQAWLRERGRGLPVGPVRVPIVPQAICFDLLNGGNKDWGRYPPYRELGYQACENSGADTFALGSVGAGLGATTVNFKGGVGSASTVTTSGHCVAALIAVNALGSATVGNGPHFWAGPYEEQGEFGGHGPAPSVSASDRQLLWKGGRHPPLATTIGIVATDAVLTKAQAQRLAIAAHDGLARALRVTHALFDGDTLFAASTGRREINEPLEELTEIGARAADCTARAIARAVFEATNPGKRLFRATGLSRRSRGLRRRHEPIDRRRPDEPDPAGPSRLAARSIREGERVHRARRHMGWPRRSVPPRSRATHLYRTWPQKVLKIDLRIDRFDRERGP